MSQLLRSQLDSEIQIYDKLFNTGRTDTVALLLLDRIEEKIKHLKRLIDGQTTKRQEVTKHRSAGGPIYNAQEAIHRYWTNGNKYHRSVSRVSASNPSSKAEGYSRI